MKQKKVSETVFAVGFAYGKSNTGAEYANILCSSSDTPSKRSSYSIFLNLDDEKEMSKYGLTASDIDFDSLSNGERKAYPLEKAVEIAGAMFEVTHAPWGRDTGRTNARGRTEYRWYSSTCVVVLASESAEQKIASAIERAYEKADAFCKGEEYLADYRRYIHFSILYEDLEELLRAVEETEVEE